jgi:predicted MFS family arabinose efflux permease
VVVVGAGAVAGILAGGRIADRWLRHGHPGARLLVPAICLLALPPLLAPAIATTSVAMALPLLIGAAVLLGAPNPPLDAARLDIMPAQLWGRAEGIRTVLRSLAEAAAPALFGYASQYVFGSLEDTYLVSLVPLLAAGFLALAALRTYRRDVATAAASARCIAGNAAGQPDEYRDRSAG